MAQRVKNQPAMRESQVRSLGLEDPLEKEMATHSSILCLERPRDRGAWWATVHGCKELDATERLHFDFPRGQGGFVCKLKGVFSEH